MGLCFLSDVDEMPHTVGMTTQMPSYMGSHVQEKHGPRAQFFKMEPPASALNQL